MRRITSLILCLFVMGPASLFSAVDQGSRSHHKIKKPAPPPPPLPSGPTGPLQSIPLDTMAPVPPQVSFENGQLTIIAPNSTLGDILRAVHKQTNAEIEVPNANDRVVTHLGPGPARDVLSELLNGSRFNYVLLGSPEDSARLTRVILVPKTGDAALANGAAGQPGTMQAGNMAQQPPQIPVQQPEAFPDDQSGATDDASADDASADQPADADQQPPPDQQGVKTPQQMLQEMQQRQMQLQQQLQSGQAPVPGAHPPQEQ